MAKKAKKKKKIVRKAKSAANKKLGRSSAAGKKVARKKKLALKKKAAAPRARSSRKPASAPKPRLEAAVIESAVIESAVIEVDVFESVDTDAGNSRLEALRKKLAALEVIEQAIRARRTFTPADELEIRPALSSIDGAKGTVRAQIAAEQTPVLQPPSAADVTALTNAIRDSENLIAQNAAVNQLVRAASALIRTLS